MSWERVLSGPGLANLYALLRDSGRHPEASAAAARLRGVQDPTPIISELGLAREDALCAAALGLFARLYGAEAGNLAMRWLAVGGAFLGGGIAPTVLGALGWGGFLEGFLAKAA